MNTTDDADQTEYDRLTVARNFAVAHNLMAGKAIRLINEILDDLPPDSAAYADLVSSRSLLRDAQGPLEADYLAAEELVRLEAERIF